jgi:tRNA nucleotidyltransferase (CCA-adding enzyme)
MRAKNKGPKPTVTHDKVITTHINADFDALASMIAAKKLYPEATLVFPGSQEKNIRNFFLHSASYLFNFTKIKQIDLSQVKTLVLVDTRQRSRIGNFVQLLDNDNLDIHIYDHHADSEEDIRGETEVIREVGSTTTILTGILKEKGIAVSPDEATIMCVGIHEDTGSFTFASTKPEDLLATAWLIQQGANLNLIADMLTKELTAEQVWLLNDLTKSATTRLINGVEIVISKVITEDYIGDFAFLVHKFMDMDNLSVVFALAQMEDKIYLVARSHVEDVNVAEIALAFGGGGHPQAASATIKNKTLIQVERSLQALLRKRVNPQKKAKDMMSSPAMHIRPHETIEKAATTMTKYDINVLLVIDSKDHLRGYITRQIVEKAVYFGLGHIQVKEYMNIEFSKISPDAPLRKVQDLIIKNKLRILPVLKQGRVVGVITRTDLMNILVGGPVIPDFLYDSRHVSHFEKQKNMAAMLKERLPRKLINLFKDIGNIADILGYNVYVVGGFVRDLFLRQENFDVDIVVEGDGIKFAHEFSQHHEVRVRSHRKFGTAVLIFPDGFKMDVATARMEYYESPAAPPTVEESSLRMDLVRRDFTINTLAIQLNKREYGALVDHFGGQKDIREKVIRVLHNLSFVEDPTRVLRAIRFEQRFGFKTGKLTLALMRNAVKIDCFKDLSGRRLFLEIKLLLMEQDPLQAIRRMDDLALLPVISPEIRFSENLRELFEEIKEVITWFDRLYLEEPYEPWLIYWYGLTASLDKKSLHRLAVRMQTGDQERRKIISDCEAIDDVLEKLHKLNSYDNYELYTLLCHYDTEILLFMMAKTRSDRVKRMLSKFFTRLKGTEVILKGKDLRDMGFKPGPLYREIFDSLLKARLNNAISTREEEVEFATKMFGPHITTQS